jgi:hypothetical protein
MRWTALLLLFGALVVGVFIPGTAGGESGIGNFVVGSGDFNPGPTRHFSVSAIGDAQGAHGQMTVDQLGIGGGPPGTLLFDVTCLSVQGNRAVVGAVLTREVNIGVVLGNYVIAFEDNGLPNGSTPDRRSVALFQGVGPPPTQTDCANAFSFAFTNLFAIDPGDVSVSGPASGAT